MRIMNKSIWPYQVKVSAREDWNEILDWCNDNVKSLYYVNNNTFCFKDSQDCTLFSLRWV
jgi:hypothetical protein